MSTTTLTNLISKVRRRAGIENDSSFISASDTDPTDATITEFINEAGAYLHQLLANSSEDYFITKDLITVASGATSLTLPDDFFKFRALDKLVDGTSDGYAPCAEYNLSERNDFQASRDYAVYEWFAAPRYNLANWQSGEVELQPSTDAPGTYLLRYTPEYTNLSTGSDNLTFPLNWHDYVVCYAAVQCLMLRNLPSDELRAHMEKLETMVVKGMTRRGQPRTMLSIRKRRH